MLQVVFTYVFIAYQSALITCLRHFFCLKYKYWGIGQ